MITYKLHSTRLDHYQSIQQTKIDNMKSFIFMCHKESMLRMDLEPYPLKLKCLSKEPQHETLQPRIVNNFELYRQVSQGNK
jgi:hypothetical protein